MKKLFLTFMLMAPAVLFARRPFDGTWLRKLDTAQFPKKPDTYLLNKGMYECSTCTPKYSVKADGTEQKVTGHPLLRHGIVKVGGRSHRGVRREKRWQSDVHGHRYGVFGWKHSDQQFTDQSEDKPVDGEVISSRVSKGPAGSHALSGS